MSETVLGFLLVLARVGGALVFVPLPGIRHGPALARLVLAGSLALALFPAWPAAPQDAREAGRLALWIVSEAAFGVTVGLAVAFLNEIFLVAAAIFGLPAGYSYAATIDPATEADSAVLLVLAQFLAGLLFFALGLHLEVMRIFARSFEAWPPGSFLLEPVCARRVIGLGAGMFSMGLRLAMPVVGLLLLADATLALLGRIHSQLQLLMLAFPVKMLAALAMLAAALGVYQRVYRGAAEGTLLALWELTARRGG
ncbi:MAG: flagellar biosynthetic protein FliR [Bryobacterales bacterium]|nr:flagellar biosynthetic protein FliR [Bryobacteraceae bacterium]MDW8130133.1 flagellar biosynthetic protein FliR [Bryobacterales bacterium]